MSEEQQQKHDEQMARMADMEAQWKSNSAFTTSSNQHIEFEKITTF
jgi:hypothetical protein